MEAVGLTPNAQRVVLGKRDGTVTLHAISDGKVLAGYRHKRRVRALAVDPFGQVAATASDDRTVRLWHLSSLVKSSR